MNGLRILNTRPLPDASELSLAINSAGGISVELAAVEIVATDLAWIRNFKALQNLEQIIFVSKNAVRHFFAGLHKFSLTLVSDVKINCVGDATANELRKYVRQVTYIPQKSTSEGLISLDNLQDVKDSKIAIVKGIDGREIIAETLTRRGAKVHLIEVYSRILPQIDKKLVKLIWQEDAVDIILFTSKQVMLNTFVIFGDAARDWLLSKPCLVISPRIATEARKLGFKVIIQASHAGILKSLEGYKL